MRVARIAVALSLIAAGCSNPEPPGLDKHSWPDLPSPQGFTYVAGYGHELKAFRVYSQSYEGQRRLDETMTWYKEAWKAHDWALKNEAAGDPSVLTFVKKEEKAVVTLASDKKAGVKIEIKVSKKDD